MLTMKRVVGPLTLAAAALLFAASVVGAATTVDRPASVVIYPKVVFDLDPPTDTIIEIANVGTAPVNLHCFYVNATKHCTNTGLACTASVDCGGLGSCVPGWTETDFSVTLTRNQPFYWLASQGRSRTCANAGNCEPLPLSGTGVCSNFPAPCVFDSECPGGVCTSGQSNAGTAIPPVPESEFFIGELKCVAVSPDGQPTDNNVVYGTATVVSTLGGVVDAQSYNAVGVRANRRCAQDLSLVCQNDGDCAGGALGPCVSAVDGDNVLVLGPNGDPAAEYQGCPENLIVDHFFDGAPDPVDGGIFVTDLTLVPCSENFALANADLGRSTAQFLVFNEFEQRFSSSLPVTCFDERLMSNIDTTNNDRSVFSVNVSGTIAGQTRIRPIGDGLLGVARAMKFFGTIEEIAELRNTLSPVVGPGAGYELHQQGDRDALDTIVLP